MKCVNSDQVKQEINEPSYSETFCEKYTSCRWILAYICFSGRLVQFAIRQSMSMAMVCIIPQNNSDLIGEQNASWERITMDSNQKTAIEYNKTGPFRVDWSSENQSLVLSAYFYGFFISTVIGGYITERVGHKIVIGLSMTTNAISTLLIPLGIINHIYIVITLRTIVGLVQGLSTPGFRGFWGIWAPKHERTQLATVTFSGTDIGNIVAFGASGYLCSTSLLGGWPLIFYGFGSLNVVWLILWCFGAFNSPDSHPRISEKEKRMIKRNTTGNTNRNIIRTPWVKIITSIPVWGIFIAAICNSWGNIVLQVMLPKYMRDVLGYDIRQNGIISMVPFVSRFFAHISISFLADAVLKKNIFKTARVRKMFQCIGFLIPAIMLVGISFLDKRNRIVTVVLLTFSITINSFSDVAFRVNHLDIAPKFASLISGICLAFSQLPGIIMPYITLILTPNGTQQEWQSVFLNCVAVYIFGSVVFVFFGEGEEQEWSKNAVEESHHTKTANSGEGRKYIVNEGFDAEEQSTNDTAAIDRYQKKRSSE